MTLHMRVWVLAGMGWLASCGGDDSGGDTSVGDDACSQSLCGCEGCPETSGPMLPTSTSAASSDTTASTASTASTGATSAPDDSTGASDPDTGPGDTGAFDCPCDPALTRLPACEPDVANCGDVTPGDECCDPRGQVYVCTQNDIGVVWIPQHAC